PRRRFADAEPEVRRRVGIAILLVVGAIACAPPAGAGTPGVADVAALQVGLWSRGLYVGDIDGWTGPMTDAATTKLERQPGRPAKDALGPFAATPFGSRSLSFGASGWDVAVLQFLLAWHGFPSGEMN